MIDASFTKGLSVLDALARSSGPRGVSDLSRELGLTKSNVHRLLQTLAHCGYVRHHEAGRYALTMKLWELGARLVAGLDVKSASTPSLQRLQDATGETVHLSLLDDVDVVYIDKIESAQPIRAHSQVGKRAPAYCVAAGKALLAFQTEDVLARAAASIRPQTARTVKDPDALMADIARVRHLGYALNRGEWREGVHGVAAPVRDFRGAVVAAICISGPESRLTSAVMKAQAAEVVRAAADVSRALGYAGGASALGETA